MESNRQIIAMGGGGFTADPQNLALDSYLLRQSTKSAPSVCFIGTATGDDPRYIAKFYSTYSRLGARPTHLPFFERTPDLRSLLLRQDIIYVGGGNTKSMLAVWLDWGLPEILREAWESGVILVGISAGAICWFEAGITDSWEEQLLPLECLGFLPGGCCPHYDGELERRPALHGLISESKFPPTLALEDGTAAHFRDTELARVVSSYPNAKAFRARLEGGKPVETPLSAELLERV